MDKRYIKGAIIGLLIGGVLLISAFFVITREQEDFGLASTEFANYASDIVGTKVGTTTTGVAFSIKANVPGQSATSSYATKISGAKEQAIYTIKFTAASSTSNALFSLQGSNDDYCDTATSTTIFDTVTTSQINWFDIGDHLLNKVHSTSLGVASSTIGITNPLAGTGKEIILDKLGYECLKLDVSGSSTVMWIQLRSK